MRRGIKFSKKAYIFLGITAIFNLLSIIFDQLVVQQEDRIRDFDQIVNEKRIEVNHNLYAHKVFNELHFKVHFKAADLITDLNYLTKATNFLNGDLPKKIDKNKIKNIKKTYIKKTKNIVTEFNKTITELQFIFYGIQEDETFIKFLEKERPPDIQWHPIYNMIRYANNFKEIHKKRKKSLESAKTLNEVGFDYLSNYNFEAKTTKEQLANYPIYLELYDDLIKLNKLKNNFSELSEDFKREFKTSFAQYYILVDDHTELNNIKNFLILVSILFQIFGLVSLVILFRVLIVENT